MSLDQLRSKYEQLATEMMEAALWKREGDGAAAYWWHATSKETTWTTPDAVATASLRTEALQKLREQINEQVAAGSKKASLAPCFSLTLGNLAALHQRLGNREAALLCLREAEALCPSLPAAESAATHLSLCALLSQLGRHAEAEKHALEAVRLGETDILSMPPIRDANGFAIGSAVLREKASSLAVALNNLAVQREFLGQVGECLALYEKAVVLAEGHMETDNPLRESHRNALQTAAERRSASFSGPTATTRRPSPLLPQSGRPLSAADRRRLSRERGGGVCPRGLLRGRTEQVRLTPRSLSREVANLLRPERQGQLLPRKTTAQAATRDALKQVRGKDDPRQGPRRARSRRGKEDRKAAGEGAVGQANVDTAAPERERCNAWTGDSLTRTPTLQDPMGPEPQTPLPPAGRSKLREEQVPPQLRPESSLQSVSCASTDSGSSEKLKASGPQRALQHARREAAAVRIQRTFKCHSLRRPLQGLDSPTPELQQQQPQQQDLGGACSSRPPAAMPEPRRPSSTQGSVVPHADPRASATIVQRQQQQQPPMADFSLAAGPRDGASKRLPRPAGSNSLGAPSLSLRAPSLGCVAARPRLPQAEGLNIDTEPSIDTDAMDSAGTSCFWSRDATNSKIIPSNLVSQYSFAEAQQTPKVSIDADARDSAEISCYWSGDDKNSKIIPSNLVSQNSLAEAQQAPEVEGIDGNLESRQTRDSAEISCFWSRDADSKMIPSNLVSQTSLAEAQHAPEVEGVDGNLEVQRVWQRHRQRRRQGSAMLLQSLLRARQELQRLGVEQAAAICLQSFLASCADAWPADGAAGCGRHGSRRLRARLAVEQRSGGSSAVRCTALRRLAPARQQGGQLRPCGWELVVAAGGTEREPRWRGLLEVTCQEAELRCRRPGHLQEDERLAQLRARAHPKEVARVLLADLIVNWSDGQLSLRLQVEADQSVAGQSQVLEATLYECKQPEHSQQQSKVEESHEPQKPLVPEITEKQQTVLDAIAEEQHAVKSEEAVAEEFLSASDEPTAEATQVTAEDGSEKSAQDAAEESSLQEADVVSPNRRPTWDKLVRSGDTDSEEGVDRETPDLTRSQISDVREATAKQTDAEVSSEQSLPAGELSSIAAVGIPSTAAATNEADDGKEGDSYGKEDWEELEKTQEQSGGDIQLGEETSAMHDSRAGMQVEATEGDAPPTPQAEAAAAAPPPPAAAIDTTATTEPAEATETPEPTEPTETLKPTVITEPTATTEPTPAAATEPTEPTCAPEAVESEAAATESTEKQQQQQQQQQQQMQQQQAGIIASEQATEVAEAPQPSAETPAAGIAEVPAALSSQLADDPFVDDDDDDDAAGAAADSTEVASGGAAAVAPTEAPTTEAEEQEEDDPPGPLCKAWSCDRCSFVNEVSPDICVLCDAKKFTTSSRPPTPASSRSRASLGRLAGGEGASSSSSTLRPASANRQALSRPSSAVRKARVS
ncbi:unnamed protein product [Polarella glacialis]|uniref:RanBP2-type domain-containing protein n=1 Tax=Polarella glacialis TaxID=89957 RepID=A0A813GRW7_POLGL|nr:unnamed protein product [Polarella glacialis]